MVAGAVTPAGRVATVTLWVPAAISVVVTGNVTDPASSAFNSPDCAPTVTVGPVIVRVKAGEATLSVNPPPLRVRDRLVTPGKVVASPVNVSVPAPLLLSPAVITRVAGAVTPFGRFATVAV
jgi:hypothetical protein